MQHRPRILFTGLMNRFRFGPAALCAGMLATIALTGCNSGNDRVAGTEVENEVNVGMVFEPDGKPAVGAEVRVVPVSFNPQPAQSKAAASAAAVYKLETDARGRFNVAAIPAGQYNILASKDGLVAYQDSVVLTDAGSRLASDTLGAPGSLTGVVRLQPNHNPATATVQLLGTTVYANVDAAGRFRMDGLAAGIYAARVATTIAGYTPLYTRFTVSGGIVNVLADTLRPVYTDIPVITGVRVAYDTASGVAKITWDRSDYPNLLGYVVYRDTLLTRTLSTQPINPFRILDTAYADTLHWALRSPDEPPQAWEYRVAVLASNGKYGETFATAELQAVSPATLRTFIGLEVGGSLENMVSVGRPFRLIARFRNASLGNVHVTWKADSLNAPLREKTLSGQTGSDTLDWIAPLKPGLFGFEARITDAAGGVWTADTALLAVTWTRGADRPWPAYARAGKFPVDMPMLALDGKAYVFGSRGQESHPAMNVYDPTTDSWSKRAEAPVLGNPVVLEGKIWLASDSSFYAYDPTADAWTVKAPLRVHRQPLTAVPTLSVNGKVVVYDGQITTHEHGTTGAYLASSMEAYDPAADSWSTLAPPYTIAQAGLITGNDRLFKTGYRTLSEYDFAGNKWSVISTGLPAEDVTPMATFENSLNLLFSQRQVMTFLLEGNTVDYRASLPALPAYTDYSFQVMGGNLYGLFQTATDHIVVAMYRRPENKWSLVPPLATHGNRFACAVVDTNIVVVSYYDLKSPRAEEKPAVYTYPPVP